MQKINNNDSEEQEDKESPEEDELASFFLSSSADKEPKLRTIGIFGDIDDEVATECIYSLLALKMRGTSEADETAPCKPIEMIVSSWGGVALDTFAIYDTMRLVREDCEIHTVGLGKVMSASVLLLAAGTKGKRKIGANCRFMLHSVMGGSHGAIHNLENEMEEVKWVQAQFIKSLVAETDMTEKQLKRLLAKKVNVYFTAKEALKYGLADEII